MQVEFMELFKKGIKNLEKTKSIFIVYATNKKQTHTRFFKAIQHNRLSTFTTMQNSKSNHFFDIIKQNEIRNLCVLYTIMKYIKCET